MSTKRLNNLKGLLKINDDSEPKYTDYEMCKQCKDINRHTCCDNCPCELSPNDLITVDENTIRRLLDTGYITLDWWEGDVEYPPKYNRVFYLRVTSELDHAQVYPGFGGRCKLLGEKGCMLEFNQRPFYGRRYSCKDMVDNSKEEACKEWRKYYNILNNVVRSYL